MSRTMVLKYCLQTKAAAVAAPGNFLKMQIIREALPQTYWIRNLGTAIHVLTTPQVILVHTNTWEPLGTREELLTLPVANSIIRNNQGRRHSFKRLGRNEGWHSWQMWWRGRTGFNKFVDWVVWWSSELPRNSSLYRIQGFQLTFGSLSLLLEWDLPLRLKPMEPQFILVKPVRMFF